ncbi:MULTISPECIES: EAL domain-containing protein [unclassified Halomonas]|uniref:bifunctional diguanylate cyclase/phosphodiesterase n=1 Tax=unclassified Halomonas TaxID=2609666 RepID=UPI002885C5EC|nr:MULTISPECIES: EAL domain-containing protein [unclassified Halomonas]MDT0501716.1 EAL domain-containing protein [Halomonas sp. PAR7]MDT0513454.1 EAL domain-containing protein [Halomonas sp. LES1]MDT0591779.1 EAL domain-containing protein [Halomonas sp. PAR8]
MPHSPGLAPFDSELHIQRDRRRAIIVYVGGMLLLLAVIGAFALEQYRRDTQAAEERNSARADLVAEWVSSIFSASEVVLASVSAHLEGEAGAEDDTPAALAHWLGVLDADLGLLDRISVLGAQGRVLASSRGDYPPGRPLGGLPYYHRLLTLAPGEQAVTPLFWSPADRGYRVVHARGLADGGVVSVELKPEVFYHGLASMSMAVGQSTAIVDTEQQLVARFPAFEEGGSQGMLGKTVHGALIETFLESGTQRGSYRLRSALDDEERFFDARRIGDLPFVTVVGEEVSVALAGWVQRLWLYLSIVAMAAGLGGLLLRHYLNRLRLEGGLRQHEAQLRIAAAAFETHLGMLITDAEGVILRANDTFTRITGYSEEEVLGRTPSLLSSGLHDEAFYAQMWDSITRRDSWQGEIWNRRRDGEVFPEWLTIGAVRNAQNELTHYVATLSDLTERKAAEREIHQLAFFDPLTGLPNRRLLMDRLQGLLRDSKRGDRFGALIYLDLDNFKRVNDTEGHRRGDQRLRQVAERLSSVTRETDTLARLGGDEFALLLHDLGECPEEAAKSAEEVALKLLSALQAPQMLDGEPLVVTGSLGVTLFHEHAVNLDGILQQADTALFQAKAAGRDTLSFFDPDIQERLQVRARLESDLRQALPRGELQLYYQPQVTAAGEMCGVEALLRWQHPGRGVVSPGEFIPLAEESRVILAIGGWALESACRQLAVWAADTERQHLVMAVNVSPVQFREGDFVEQVLAILDATRAPAKRLKLEVTESLFMEERDDARAKMLRLSERGVTFSLDDFGTGYSSLSYLKRLPLAQLKIDQSFVRDLLEDQASAAIVTSVISLARSLELDVIAEGVETEAQRDWLINHGCTRFQGYLFSRPQPIEWLPVSAAG